MEAGRLFSGWLRALFEPGFQFPFAFVQGLEAQLPSLDLNVELVDVAGDFGALGFVFFELPFQVVDFAGNALGVLRNLGGPAAFLAGKRHPRGGGVHDERGGAMRACENDVGIAHARGGSC